MGEPVFTPVTAQIVDQFGGPTEVTVTKALQLCAPTNANGTDPAAPSEAEHLSSYKIKAVGFEKRYNVEVVNAFDQEPYQQPGLRFDVIRPVRIMIPSAMDRSSGPTPLASPQTDHFTCYRVQRSRGTPKFMPVPAVAVDDELHQLTSIIVQRPTMLCAPTDMGNEAPGAEAHAPHLMCYQIKLPVGAAQFAKVLSVFVNDSEFGLQTFDLLRPRELCVPSTTILH
ncbi:MAG TPA: hypothetical protein VLN59_13270 [Burkholderiales bacterium]|nr:hypothetical protein [Burkholderiales bacterium]